MADTPKFKETFTLVMSSDGETCVIDITIGGQPFLPIVTAKIDPALLAASCMKTVQALADPVGPCENVLPV